MGYSVEIMKNIPGPRQCHNCQEYDHTKNVCERITTCVRCGDDHKISNCPRAEPPKCANCGSPHVASYRNCEKRLALMKNIVEMKAQTSAKKTNQWKAAAATPQTTDPNSYPPTTNAPHSHEEPPWMDNIQRMFTEMQSMVMGLDSTINILVQKLNV